MIRKKLLFISKLQNKNEAKYNKNIITSLSNIFHFRED